MSYVLGIDLGTSSLKGSLYNHEGVFIASASSDYSLISAKKGYSEQDPNEWIMALDKVFLSLINKVDDLVDELEGLSFSGQMHSLVLIDENLKVLRNAILWNDVRTTKQCKFIMDEFGDTLLEITNNIALEGFTLPKILWVQENEPEIWRKVYKILLPKDFLGFFLTGELFTDFSDAAGTLLLDIKNRKWSKEISGKFNVPIKLLPPILESTDKVGVLKKELIDKYGFKHNVDIFAGGADNACGAVGAGIVNQEKSMVSIGTSGVFLSFEEDPNKKYDGKLHYFNHAIKDQYYSMGVTLAAGNSLSWFKNTFASGKNFDELLSNIDSIKPGSEGLLFTPYISGERTPYFDSKIRGSFIGIDIHHNLDHFIRAVIEGITFSLKESQEIFFDLSKNNSKEIVTIGGGSKNKNWLQIQADIFNSTMLTLEVDQGPGLGAAMIAAVGKGWFKSFDECAEKFITYRDRIQPNPERVKIYKNVYTQYKKIYPSTREIFTE